MLHFFSMWLGLGESLWGITLQLSQGCLQLALSGSVPLSVEQPCPHGC